MALGCPRGRVPVGHRLELGVGLVSAGLDTCGVTGPRFGAMGGAGVDEPPIVTVEATAAISMLLVRDHGVVTVHFVGIPPGTPTSS